MVRYFLRRFFYKTKGENIMYYNDINQVSLSGYLTADPALIERKDGKVFAKVRFASNKSWTHNETRHSSAVFSEIVFNNKADIKMISSHLKKGDRVYVTGSLIMSKPWKNSKGVNCVHPIVVADEQTLRVLRSKAAEENTVCTEANVE
jgi:single stranded DNA-binding protein